MVIIKEENSEIDILKNKIDNANVKISELEESLNEAYSTISVKDEKINNLKAEFDDLKSKVSVSEEEKSTLISQIEELNNKINELNNLISQKEAEIQEINKIIAEKDKFIKDQSDHIKKVEIELNELKPPEIGVSDLKSEERISCPMCGAVGKNVKVIDDKSKVLSYVGNIPMYAKKHVCKQCGYEF